ncbi:hypothetical protein [Aeromonas finlandensis]|uniref:hypothetical protein n=1 Tax=Aeromonas finlandensis TaxID=1543375 RepID=UPI0012E0008F|nr:hypothetical protein [Aeromonas finlandensis]
MTLIVAGYNSQALHVGDNGIFVVSDSSITSGGRILVRGFKKVIEMPIRVMRPLFNDGWFHNYYGFQYEGACLIAFAGSTLVAQHIINSIKNHLSELYPIHENGEYLLAMSCEKERLLHNNVYCEEDMFLDEHVIPTITLSFLSDVVEHSIQAVLDHAKKHDGMKDNFTAFKAEFIFGARCPSTNELGLFQFEIIEDEIRGALVKKTKVSKGDIAVIGMRTLYAADAQIEFNDALENRESVEIKMLNFVSKAIDSQNEIGVFDIGKPCALYKFNGGTVKLCERITE